MVEWELVSGDTFVIVLFRRLMAVTLSFKWDSCSSSMFLSSKSDSDLVGGTLDIDWFVAWLSGVDFLVWIRLIMWFLAGGAIYIVTICLA